MSSSKTLFIASSPAQTDMEGTNTVLRKNDITDEKPIDDAANAETEILLPVMVLMPRKQEPLPYSYHRIFLCCPSQHSFRT